MIEYFIKLSNPIKSCTDATEFILDALQLEQFRNVSFRRTLDKGVYPTLTFYSLRNSRLIVILTVFLHNEYVGINLSDMYGRNNTDYYTINTLLDRPVEVLNDIMESLDDLNDVR